MYHNACHFHYRGLVLSAAMLLAASTSTPSQFLTDSNCPAAYHCQVTACHIDSLDELQAWRPVVTASVLFLPAALAVGGGGGIFDPVCIASWTQSSERSRAVSGDHLAGSIVYLILNTKLQHPAIPDKYLIDFDVILMFSPMLLAGTITGVIMNCMFPSWLLVLSW